MEDTLGGLPSHPFKIIQKVLILVLMEDTLGVYNYGDNREVCSQS